MEGRESIVGHRPTIFFATVIVGGGHVATARAISEAIETLYPGDFSLPVSDYADYLGVTGMDRRHKAFWRSALRYPVIARAGQRLIDSFPRLTVAGQRRLVGGFARAAAHDLGRKSPLLVVSNHGLLTTGLALARERYGLKVPVLTYATEPHRISAYWADPRAEHIVVPAEEVRWDLIRMGVPAGKIAVVGYPVRQSFLNAPAKAEARKSLGLEDRFTCLISLGGEGVVVGKPHRIVQALLDSETTSQVVVVTGRNKRLRRELESLDKPGLRVEGFVEEMALYVSASDVVIGKAGPASVYESLAVGRPVIVTGHAGLNEKEVAEFIERSGFGSYAKTPEALSKSILRYASNPALLEDVALRSRRLSLAKDTGRLARYVVEYAMEDRAARERRSPRSSGA